MSVEKPVVRVVGLAEEEDEHDDRAARPDQHEGLAHAQSVREDPEDDQGDGVGPPEPGVEVVGVATVVRLSPCEFVKTVAQ